MFICLIDWLKINIWSLDHYQGVLLLFYVFKDNRYICLCASSYVLFIHYDNSDLETCSMKGCFNGISHRQSFCLFTNLAHDLDKQRIWEVHKQSIDCLKLTCMLIICLLYSELTKSVCVCQGLVVLIPGFVIVGMATNLIVLYIGLSFFAFG